MPARETITDTKWLASFTCLSSSSSYIWRPFFTVSVYVLIRIKIYTIFDLFFQLALDSCEPEGSIQLAMNTTREFKDQTYHLLQVCLFGHWSYVHSKGFSKSDKAIALYQLGCTKGGKYCLVKIFKHCCFVKCSHKNGIRGQ